MRLLILLFLFPLHSSAELKDDMQQILSNYVKIIPYTQNDKSLDDKHLISYLDQLKKSIKNSKNVLHTKSPTFSSNIKFLENNIAHIKKGIEHKHYNYSREQIKSLVSNCISCHAQLPSKQYNKISSKYSKTLNKQLKSNYEKGMLSYFLRDYKKTILHLTKDLDTLNGRYKQERRIVGILKIYTMNTKDFLSAKIFIQNLKNDKTIKVEKSLLTKWELDLTHWKKFNTKKQSDKNVKDLIAKYLTPIENEIKLANQFDNQINLFSMQGILTNHLIRSPKTKLKAESLYWLGLLENSTPSLYSLGDMYLIDCIKKYPKSEFAKKCYQSYSDSVEFGFTGSAGTHIPKDIKDELNKLKVLITN